MIIDPALACLQQGLYALCVTTVDDAVQGRLVVIIALVDLDTRNIQQQPYTILTTVSGSTGQWCPARFSHRINRNAACIKQ